MPENRVQVTYAAPSHLQSSDQWTLLRSGLAAQFPLRDLQWKPATRVSVRIIQDLDVTLVPFESVREENVSQIPTSLLEKPLVNLYVVSCEDNEVYKNTVKRQIKDWHTTVTQRRNQEWLIVFVTRPDAKAAPTGILKMRGTLLDRVRADFNVDKRDRCVQLTWSNFSGGNDTANWTEVVSRLKDGISSAFDSAVYQREEDVKRSEGQKLMPGWNFCTFFILKESLASSFEGMNLLDDALIQYDELEAAFFQVLKDKSLTWFGKLVDAGAKDDSLPLLSVGNKPYRDLILSNAISVFDFRVYLLARQCTLLGQMGRVEALGKKVAMFLGAFGKRLREVQDELSPYFIESWTYMSATSTVEKCDGWMNKQGFTNGNSSLAFPGANAAKAELLDLALTQLDRLGIVFEYLPYQPPFSCCTSDIGETPVTTSVAGATESFASRGVLTFMGDAATFHEQYIRLTNKTIDLYVKAGRRKFALKLHARLAALDVFKHRHQAALQVYTSLPAHYNPYRWCDLEVYALFNSLENHRHIGSPHDREWLHTAMAFLKTFVVSSQRNMVLGTVDDPYISELVTGVHTAASHLQSDLVLQNHPFILVQPIRTSCRFAELQDGHLIDMDITNELPVVLHVDEIALTGSGRGNRAVRFSTGATTLGLGKSRCSLSCMSPLSGLFNIDVVEVRIGRMVVQWPWTKQGSTSDNAPSDSLIRLLKNADALDVDIRQPLRVCYGDEKEMLVVLKTGRNKLERGYLKLTSIDVQLHIEKCKQLDSPETMLYEDGKVVVQPGTSGEIAFLLPYTSSTNLDRALVNVEIEYVTVAESNVVRTLVVSRVVNTSQHLMVNVTDHFRGERMFSSFTVSTTSNQHVYISSATLTSPEDEDGSYLRILYRKGKTRRTIVTPSQPATFVFQIIPNNEVDLHRLVFCVKFSLLREEVESIVRCTAEILADLTAEQRGNVCTSVVRALESDASWVQVYESTGEIRVPEIDVEENIRQQYLQVTEVLRNGSFERNGADVLREATMQLDLPRIDIVAAARIRLLPNSTYNMKTSNAYFAGQPIHAVLSIHVSLRWSGQSKNVEDEFQLRFSVDEMLKHWLIGGQRQGEFLAKNGSTFSVPLTLMALRHGELPLPQIQISALSAPSADGMRHALVPTLECYQEHGAERVKIFPRSSRTTFMFQMTQDS